MTQPCSAGTNNSPSASHQTRRGHRFQGRCDAHHYAGATETIFVFGPHTAVASYGEPDGLANDTATTHEYRQEFLRPRDEVQSLHGVHDKVPARVFHGY